MKENSSAHHNNYCNVLEQRHLVSRMTECDKKAGSRAVYECYLNVTKESRQSNACMFA